MPLWNNAPDAWHEVLPRVHRRVLAHGPSLTLVLYRIAPGSVFPRHTHPHVQAGTFLEGGGTFTVGDVTWEVRPGSSYYIPGGVPHELHATPDGPSVVLDAFSPERPEFAAEVRPPDRP